MFCFFQVEPAARARKSKALPMKTREGGEGEEKKRGVCGGLEEEGGEKEEEEEEGGRVWGIKGSLL